MCKGVKTNPKKCLVTYADMIDFKLSDKIIDLYYYGKQTTETKINPNIDNYTFTTFIYDDEIHKVQQDSYITELVVNYDKQFIRESFLPYIQISVSFVNYEECKKRLKTKYNINIDNYITDMIKVDVPNDVISKKKNGVWIL